MQSEPNEIQPELFDQFTDTGLKPKQKNQRRAIGKRLPPHFAFTLSYESVIIAIIVLISLIVASFSLGIKRGASKDALISLRAQEGTSISKSTSALEGVSALKNKTASTLKGTRKHTSTSKNVSRRDVGSETPLPIDNVVKTKEPTVEKKTPIYVIQVATFKQKALARKEISRLKKLNYNSFSKVKGKFHLVFVGNYPSKELAGQDLKRLRNVYSDCFVKKIESR